MTENLYMPVLERAEMRFFVALLLFTSFIGLYSWISRREQVSELEFSIPLRHEYLNPEFVLRESREDPDGIPVFCYNRGLFWSFVPVSRFTRGLVKQETWVCPNPLDLERSLGLMEQWDQGLLFERREKRISVSDFWKDEAWNS